MPQHVPDVDPVLVQWVLVQALLVADALQDLGIAVLAGGNGDGIAGAEAGGHERDEGDGEEDQRRPEEAPQYVGHYSLHRPVAGAALDREATRLAFAPPQSIEARPALPCRLRRQI